MVTMNIGALRGAQRGAGDRDGLAAMKASFASIASDLGMFGDVPNAPAASAALERAARDMLRELERAGHTVLDIRDSAAAAAGIGEDADEEARGRLTAVQVDAIRAFTSAVDTGR
ncbi:hypothetical protein RM780_01680 [Streptomyces sp. DSM 44917]|uniref:Uncharacterized protein n=1 Tax=Streptomyces boetiae TaxID=3075541 RepID=A0ABU2L284_9ACTN|nr:hypothetical protein [Streptomyces sp. DSM 44917]MDT0305674.1 hypothetical protein [Streptomyces sp. DSM 44917]